MWLPCRQIENGGCERQILRAKGRRCYCLDWLLQLRQNNGALHLRRGHGASTKMGIPSRGGFSTQKEVDPPACMASVTSKITACVCAFCAAEMAGELIRNQSENLPIKRACPRLWCRAKITDCGYAYCAAENGWGIDQKPVGKFAHQEGLPPSLV